MLRDERSIHGALAVIINSAGQAGWVLGGSSGLMLRGLALDIPPRDIDLYCDDQEAEAIHRSLSGYATDEPVISETDIYRSRLSHYSIGGVSVELVGGFQVAASGCFYKVEVKKVLIPYGEQMAIQACDGQDGLRMRVVPLAHELWFNALRGREDRVELVAGAMAHDPASHAEALAAIEQGNEFSLEMKESVHRRLKHLKEGVRIGR
ncbi:hypothetical protein ACFQZE_02665 [Paenibacillus sp. GCM10027627]|uniref:hypothetical protein n=1 Tax=unclassified Paenibacillus TaxID=185978 RepID=UPI003635481A